MCMKKIIFLDFDGVLNTEYNQNLLMYHGKSWNVHEYQCPRT